MITPEGVPPGGWRFVKLSSEHGRDLIEDWISGLPVGDRKGVRTELRVLLRNLRLLPGKLWGRPQFSWLNGSKYHGIGEIIFDYRKVEYRVLGCFGPAFGHFALLIGATKRSKRKRRVQWSPEHAPDTAVNRKKDLESGRAVYDFELYEESNS
jgi:hypothetical protein